MAVQVTSSPAISVLVTSDSAAGVSVSGGDVVGVSVSGGIGPTIIVSGTATNVVGSIGVQPFAAGANITITTAAGSIQIASADAPVKTVNGKTGFVVLSASDVTAAAVSHTHSTAQITGLTAAISSFANVKSVAGRTGEVVLNTQDLRDPDGWIRFDNVAVTSDYDDHVKITNNLGMQVTFAENPVFFADNSGMTISGPLSFFGSPTATLGMASTTLSRLGGAPVSHTHSASQISNLTTVANVVSVQGKTGAVVLIDSDLPLHTHTTTDITGFTAALQGLSAPVVSVQGRTGAVVITRADLTAAAASHFHSTSEITDLGTYSMVRSLNDGTGNMVLSAGANVSIARNQNTITISAVNSGQIAAAVWPAIILGG